MKTCRICNETKPIGNFRKQRRCCKKCEEAKRRERYRKNPARYIEAARKWRGAHPEKKHNNRWNKEHPEKAREAVKRWHLAHPEKAREDAKMRTKKWRESNPERAKEVARNSTAKRVSTPVGKINANISRGILHSLKSGTKANQHWESLVGYTIDQLKKHLEKRFKPGMTWENYGKLWEIDHKNPIAVFNFERPGDIDFHLCWSLKNLQPLEKVKNRSKSNKIEKPFQPSLMVG